MYVKFSIKIHRVASLPFENLKVLYDALQIGHGNVINFPLSLKKFDGKGNKAPLSVGPSYLRRIEMMPQCSVISH